MHARRHSLRLLRKLYEISQRSRRKEIWSGSCVRPYTHPHNPNKTNAFSVFFVAEKQRKRTGTSAKPKRPPETVRAGKLAKLLHNKGKNQLHNPEVKQGIRPIAPSNVFISSCRRYRKRPFSQQSTHQLAVLSDRPKAAGVAVPAQNTHIP